jgi:hypothetical protein
MYTQFDIRGDITNNISNIDCPRCTGIITSEHGSTVQANTATRVTFRFLPHAQSHRSYLNQHIAIATGLLLTRAFQLARILNMYRHALKYTFRPVTHISVHSFPDTRSPSFSHTLFVLGHAHTHIQPSAWSYYAATICAQLTLPQCLANLSRTNTFGIFVRT